MKTVRILLFVLLISTLILSACSPPGTAAPEETQPPEQPAEPTEAPEPTEAAMPEGVTCDEPIKVGLITDATGPLAVYGAHIWRSFMLGMEYATGAPGSVGDVFAIEDERNTFTLDGCEIEVVLGDDQSNPENTATIAREMIEVEGVDVLVGTVSSGATATLQEIAAENQIPLIVAPAASSDITGVNFNEYTFRTSRMSYQDAMPLCSFYANEYDNFVNFAADYTFGWAGAAAYTDACTQLGATFVADDIYAPLDTSDFTPYMEQVLDSGADVFMVTWAGGGFIPMMQAAVDLGVMDEMEVGSPFIDNVAMPSFFANLIGTTSSIIYHYTAPDNEINDWLVENTKARYGVPPDLFDADGMNAAIMLTEGLTATGGDTSGEALIDAWEGVEFEGPKGTVYIRPEDHVAIQDMYVLTLTNLDDPESKFFEYVDTVRPDPPCLLPEELKDRCGDLPYGSLTGEAIAPPQPEAALTCDEPVKVGLITDATGPLAVYGAHIWRSFMLGMEYGTGASGSVGDVFAIEDERNTFSLDDCEIEVVMGDDQSNPENTATIAREMIEVEGVDVLVGTVSSGATATLQEIAAENQIPLIVAPAASSDITGVNFNEYTFRTSRMSYQDAMPLCSFYANEYDNFVNFAADYSFGWAGAAAYTDACTQLGATFVAEDIYAPLDTSDFTPYMEQVLDSGADVFMVTWAGGGFIPMMQAAVDLGVMDEMEVGSPFIDNVAMPSFFANLIGTTSSIIYHYTAPDNEINDWLVENTIDRYGVPPDLFDADGMNAAIMLLETLRSTDGSTDPASILAAMEGIEFEGPKGTIEVRPEDHVALQDMYILTLTNLDDPESKFFEYVDTVRPDPPCLLPEELQDRCGDLPYGSLTGE